MQVEEFYVITWEAKKEQIFELPTGGAAIMQARFFESEELFRERAYADDDPACYCRTAPTF